jgi:hypothetical protein
MKLASLVLLLSALIATPSAPARADHYPNCSNGAEWVNGYFRKDGTYVNGYWRCR